MTNTVVELVGTRVVEVAVEMGVNGAVLPVFLGVDVLAGDVVEVVGRGAPVGVVGATGVAVVSVGVVSVDVVGVTGAAAVVVVSVDVVGVTGAAAVVVVSVGVVGAIGALIEDPSSSGIGGRPGDSTRGTSRGLA